jgi:hypothetical protein
MTERAKTLWSPMIHPNDTASHSTLDLIKADA